MMLRLTVLVLLSMIAFGPAQAQPAAGAGRYAAYGPLHACIGDYAVEVRAGEAVSAYVGADGRPQNLQLLTEVPTGFNAILAASPVAEVDQQAAVSSISMPNGFPATRIAHDDWEGYRAGIPGEVVFTRIRAHRTYALPQVAPGGEIALSAALFSGRYDDRALLDRVRLRTKVTCGALEAPSRPGAIPTAALWSPTIRRGPLALCSNGVRIMLPAGTELRRTWRTSPDDVSQFELRMDGQFYTFGAFWVSSRRPPTGSLLAMGYTASERLPNYASYTAPQIVRADPNAPSFIGIQHQNATHAQLDALMGLLSFVGTTTRRCDAVWN